MNLATAEKSHRPGERAKTSAFLMFLVAVLAMVLLSSGSSDADVALDEEFEVTGILYRVTSVDPAEITLVKNNENNSSTFDVSTQWLNGTQCYLTSVEDGAFKDKTAVQNLDLPYVRTIGSQAFLNCDNLYSITLPALTSMGSEAFSDCDKLEKVLIPPVKTLGDKAFYGCDKLVSVYLDSAETIGNYAFQSCPAIETVHLPSVKTIGTFAFDSSNMKYISLSENLAALGDMAFSCNFLYEGEPIDQEPEKLKGYTFYGSDGNEVDATLEVGNVLYVEGFKTKITSTSPLTASMTECVYDPTVISIDSTVNYQRETLTVNEVGDSLFC